MNSLTIAEQLLKARSEITTDATAFTVSVIKDKKGHKVRLELHPDMERRGDRDNTFYHMESVVDICRPLHLSHYVTTKTYEDVDGRIRATLEVHIY